MGDIKLKYATSVAPTVTNLHSLASSQDWLAGWGSASVNNTANLYSDYIYAATFTSHASNRQAGSIYVYAVGALNDTPTWPAVASGTLGTEGAISFTDTEERDALLVRLGVFTADNTASAIMVMPPTSLAAAFGGIIPPYHCLYIAQNLSTTTTAGLAAAGSAVYYTPLYHTY